MKNVQDMYPVSPMQELMLLHTLSRRGADTLFNQFQFEIDGAFDPQAFERAWQAIVDRHDALRTAFIWENVKQPLQIVRRSVAIDIPVDDLRTHDADAQRRSIDTYLQDDRDKGFELQRAPLMRFRLFRLADEKWRFVWTSHHLIVDRWCLGEIYRELDRYYARLQTSGLTQESTAAPSFKVYVDWLSRQDKAATLAHWSELLRGYEPAGSLFGADAGPAGAQRETGGNAELEIDAAAAAELDDFARRNALTPGIVAQAAWSLTLNHLLRSQDVAFGVTVSGRPADIPDVDSIIGSFINNVPVRDRLPASMPVLEWLKNLQAQQLGRLRHEYLGSAELGRHLTGEQLNVEFESLLVWLAEVGGTHEFDMRPVGADYGTAYPLTVSVLQGSDGMRVRIDATGNCEHDLDEVLSIFERALHSIVHAEAYKTIGDLPVFRPQASFEYSVPSACELPTASGQLKSDDELPDADVAGGRERLGTDVLLELVEAEWASVLSIEDIGRDEDFFAAGGTSLQAAALHWRLESATRQSIPMLALFRNPTIEGMVATIFEQDWPVRTDIVNCVRAGSGGAPLFCVASPEVNTVGYSLLARHLDDKLGLFVLQSPPEDNQLRQIHPDALPELAKQYVESMRRVQPHGPYRLLGMCTGSHIALEMVRQLEAESEAVEFLGVINTWALYTISRLYYVNRMMSIGRYLLGRVRDLVPVPAFLRHAHADDTQLAISTRAEVVTAESLEGDGSAWIHDVGFASRNPGLPKVATEATVIRLKRHPQSFWRIRDASLGWSKHAADVDVVRISGDNHDYVMREPYIDEVATVVQDRLSAPDADRTN